MKKLFILLTLVCSSAALCGEWFVSPNGSDDNAGSNDSPFATIVKARDAVRAARAGGDNGRHNVIIGAGTYEVTEPIVFDTRDSNTSYLGERGKTIISGGMKLGGWSDAGNGVWVAELPKIDGRQLYFEQLFVNNRRAVRSRYPNTGFLKPKEVRQGVSITDQSPKPAFTEQSIVAADGDIDFLKNVPADELKYGQFIVHHHWDTTRRIPLSVDAEQNLVKMQGEPMKHWNPWRNTSLYYFENFRTAFDAAGEWFYDGVHGKVFYRPLPDEKLETSNFVVPRNGVNQLLLIKGKRDNGKDAVDKIIDEQSFVRMMNFVNITFAYTDSPRREKLMRDANLPTEVTGDLRFAGPGQINPEQAAFWANAVIDVDTAESINFAYCSIDNVGEYGLWLKNARACRVDRCSLTNLGAGGIRIGGVGETSENTVDNCIIQNGGRLYACAVAVWIGNHTHDNNVTHNDIGDFYYTGVSAGWTWGYKGGFAERNVIEFNRIHDLGQGAMADMGGVYTLGTSHGTRVCNNVIFNVESYAYGGWGLYPDEGSEGILMENNLVYDTSDGSFHQHYGKDNVIRNNILAFSRPHQVAVTRVEPHLSFTFENNIIYWTKGDAIGYSSEKARVDWGSNTWWNAVGNVNFKGKTHKEWVELGKDVGGIVADPKFVDAEKRDFRLQEDSPAIKQGFVPFDFSKAGVYGDEEWKRRALQ